MKVLVVGCGSISETWLKASQEISAIEIVGLVDLSVELANKRVQQFELDVPVGSNLSDVLSGTRPEVVFDCTVPRAHYEVTLTALNAGCHVFGEKPMAESLGQAHEMVATAKAAGKTFAVMQNRRYDRNLRRLKNFLASGVLGTVTTINADFYLGAHFGGFRDTMQHVLIKDMAIHTFDAARYLIAEDPRAVYCYEWNPSGSWYEQDASAVAIFEMGHGVVFNYRGSWCAEGLRTAWESEWRIIGTRGSVSWDGMSGFKAEVVENDSGFFSSYNSLEVPILKATELGEGHLGAIQAFVSALENYREPDTVCTDNIKSLAMVLAAIESAETQKRVSFRAKTSS